MITAERIAQLIHALRQYESHSLPASHEVNPTHLITTGIIGDTVAALRRLKAIDEYHVHLSGASSRNPDARVYTKRDVEALVALTVCLDRTHRPWNSKDGGCAMIADERENRVTLRFERREEYEAMVKMIGMSG